MHVSLWPILVQVTIIHSYSGWLAVARCNNPILTGSPKLVSQWPKANDNKHGKNCVSTPVWFRTDRFQYFLHQIPTLRLIILCSSCLSSPKFKSCTLFAAMAGYEFSVSIFTIRIAESNYWWLFSISLVSMWCWIYNCTCPFPTRMS